MMYKKLLFCLALALLTVGGLTACRGGDTSTETDTAGGASTGAVTLDTTNDTNTPDTGAADTGTTDTEALTTDGIDESETNPSGPVYEPTALPAANVAREGFAIASSTKWNTPWDSETPVYSNLHINDGDPATVWVSEWGPNNPYGMPFNPNAEHYVYIDLTRPYKVEALRIHPAPGYEGGFPADFDVLVSSDGSTYTKITSVTGATAEAATGGLLVDMDGVDCEYVKLAYTKLGPGDEERGPYIALGEVEVIAPIDTASNMMLNRDGLWLFKDPDTTWELKVDYYRDGTAVDPQSKLTYTVADTSVATVSESGLITPVAFGKTEVYVSDGQNRSTCVVEVKKDIGEDEFLISAMHITTYQAPDSLESSIDLLVKSGVEHLEAAHWFDTAGNVVHWYTIHLCHERGAMYSPWDSEGKLTSMSDEQLIEIVQKYEGIPGVAGVLLTDEPSTWYTDCARVMGVMAAYNPHYTYYVNLLPPTGAAGETEYYTEFCSLAGHEWRNKYLTYDHYPFTTGGGFDSWVYSSLDQIRKAGLQYNWDTGYYLQSQINLPTLDGIYGGTRHYNASLGIAYGMKNYKHYLSLCPFDYNTGASAYDAGILDRNYEPAPYYNEIIENNRYIKNAGKLLGTADAIEVYHTNRENGAEVVPDDFIFTRESGTNLIFTLYETHDGSRQYVAVTNKTYKKRQVSIVKIKVNQDLGALSYYDPMTGETQELYIEDGSFTLVLEPGSSVVVILPEGVDASRKVDKSENLALGMGVYVTTSQTSFHEATKIGSYYLTDGNHADGAWLSARSDRAPSMVLDLRQVQTISRIDLYENTRIRKTDHLTDFKIEVSEDGKTYTEVLTVTGATYDDLQKAYECRFDSVSARYIRITSTKAGAVGMGEIEVYA